MAFFDDVKDTIGGAGAAISDKVKDTSETMRLNNAIKAKEKEIEQIYLLIGKGMFNEQREFCVEKFPQYAEKVQELMNQIAENDARVKEINSSVYCKNPECGAKIKPGTSFCMSCGTPVQVAKPKVEYASRVCTNCGNPVGDDDKFCDKCGTKIEEKKVEDVVEEIAPEVEEEPDLKCSKCGHVVKEDDIFCEQCGTKIERQEEIKPQVVDVDKEISASELEVELGTTVETVLEESTISEVISVSEDAIPKCPKCGNIVNEDDKFCIECGSMLK